MKANANLCLTGQACWLVPYCREHVEQYHAWMQDPALLEATASEPLSLEEEYAMQKSWLEDEKKCTFIIIDKSLLESAAEPPHTQGMAGDVNLYWNDLDDDNTAEIEVMVAAQESKRKGIAKEALQMLMSYAIQDLGVRCFRAKIGSSNEPSLALFKALRYAFVSHSNYFEEDTLELREGEALYESLKSVELARKSFRVQ